MTISVSLLPAEFESVAAGDEHIAVIDVFRASTSIITALANGAEKILPLCTPEEARARFTAFSENQAVLCGERGSIRIRGFTLGNSPKEYSREAVRDKVILYTSTNGAQMLNQATCASEVLVAGFVNCGAVVRRIARTPSSWVLACAGTNGHFSLEDTVCAGMIATRLIHLLHGKKPILNDGAHAAMSLFRSYAANLMEMSSASRQGQILSSLGLEEDLADCIAVDAYDLIPQLLDGELKPVQNG